MANVIGVRFRNAGKIYYLILQDLIYSKATMLSLKQQEEWNTAKLYWDSEI